MIKCLMDPAIGEDSKCAKCCIYCKDNCDLRCELAKEITTEEGIIKSDCPHAYEY